MAGGIKVEYRLGVWAGHEDRMVEGVDEHLELVAMDRSEADQLSIPHPGKMVKWEAPQRYRTLD